MSDTQFRQLKHGFLVAIRRGPPPTPPEGYEVAQGDPYVFLPILKVCGHREKRITHRSCCGAMERIFCTRRNDYVTRSICKDCE